MLRPYSAWYVSKEVRHFTCYAKEKIVNLQVRKIFFTTFYKGLKDPVVSRFALKKKSEFGTACFDSGCMRVVSGRGQDISCKRQQFQDIATFSGRQGNLSFAFPSFTKYILLLVLGHISAWPH